MSKERFSINYSQNDEVTIAMVQNVRNYLKADAAAIIYRRSMPTYQKRALIELLQNLPYLRKTPDYIMVSTMPRGGDVYDVEAGFLFAKKKAIQSYRYRLEKLLSYLADAADSTANEAVDIWMANL